MESANEHKPPRRGGGNSTRKHSRARVARRPAAVLHPAQPRCASISDAHPNPDTTSGRRRNKPAPEPPYPFHLPTTPANLHTFIKDELSYDIQRTSYIPGHSAPFDYLIHTFFEGLGNFEQLHSHPEVPLGRATDTPNDCVVWACRGGGKTFLGALATLLDLIFKPNIEIRIIGGSLDQSRRMFNHLKKFFKIHNFSTHLAGKIGRCGLTLQNGSHVEILAQSETAIRGTRIQKLRCDEVALFKPEVWQAAQLVTRTMTTTLTVAHAGHERQVDLIVPGAIEAFSTMHEAGTVMDSAVNDAHNGTRTLFKWGIADIVEGATEADRASLLRVEPALAPHTTLQEQGDKESINPPPAPCLPLSLSPFPSPLSSSSGHIPITDAFSLMSRVSHEAWQSEMLCLRPSRSNLVYNDFNEHTHLFTDAPWERAGILRCVMGMDFGFRGETVILWGVLDAELRLYIVDEIAKAERSLQWHIDAMNSKCAAIGLPRPDWIGIDPAANQRNFHSAISSRDALVRAGFATRDRALTVEHGIDLVKARLAPAGQLSRNDAPPNHTIPAPRLFIHARCTRLVESLRTYHYDHKNKRSGVPIKDGPDHACDALRYLVINLERPCNNAISRYL